jgi:hypothetical protein
LILVNAGPQHLAIVQRIDKPERKLNMKSALALATLALTVLASAAMAQPAHHTPRGSVIGPYYNPSYNAPYVLNNSTGTVPDSARDPHNDR